MIMLTTIQSRSFRLLCKRVKSEIYKIITLPVVLYGYETWSLMKEHRLRVFENRVRRTIFGPKRNQIIGGWRKLHNEDLHNLYPSPDIIRTIKSMRMRWTEHPARMQKRRFYAGIWWESQKKRDA
jgi:hypothetical protein